MAAWSTGRSLCWLLLLLLLLPTLLLAQDDCSHNCKNEANRYYYVRPEGSAETLCPAQPCLTPSQLRDHFSECEHNNSCQTANTSLVLLPGTYTLDSDERLFFPPINFSSLAGYNDCNTDSFAIPSIDCNGASIFLSFEQIKCLYIQNCVVFTGHDTNTTVNLVTFHDTLIRLASITAADHSELDYDFKLGSQSYCLLQKQLADINALTSGNSMLTLRNVSFSSNFHSQCASEYGIQLTTIHALESALDIADCLFTQSAITHVSLLHSTLHASGMVQFENANTAIMVNNSTIALEGEVKFFSNEDSAIQAIDAFSTIHLAGTVEFTNNTADSGGAILIVAGSLTIGRKSQTVFKGNHASNFGGAIVSGPHVTVTIAGSVQFINNSAHNGGAIDSDNSVTIADNAEVVFQGNYATNQGGGISCAQNVTIAGTVQFLNNSAHQGGAIICNSLVIRVDVNAQVIFCGNNVDFAGGAIFSFQYTIVVAGTVQFINNSALQGGAIDSDDSVLISLVDNTLVTFGGNTAKEIGGAIAARNYVSLDGSVQFINNSASQGGAIGSAGSVYVVTVDNDSVVFQGNHAKNYGGAIFSKQDLYLSGLVEFVKNSAYQGGAIFSTGNIVVANTSKAVFQGNRASKDGGALGSGQHTTIAGSVHFINNTADQGGAINSNDNVTIDANAQISFCGNNADTAGGAISSVQHVTVAGTVQFIENSALQGGAIDSDGSVSITNSALVIFSGNNAETLGGAIASHSQQYVTIAGEVQFINNSGNMGGAVASAGNVSIVDNAQVSFQGNHANYEGGAIQSSQHVTITGSVQFINSSAYQGGAISSDRVVSIGANAQVVFQGNHADNIGGAILSSVILAGSVQFINNTAQLGGAISMLPGPITVANDANVTFQGNHAYRVGGAVSSESGFLYSVHRSETCLISFGINSTVNFIHNTAKSGGSAMYGITMSRLECGASSNDTGVYEYLYDVITIIPDSFSAVSSNPLRVCICPDQSTPDCLAILPDQNIPHLHYTVYPGQNFTIPAAVVGFNFALTSGSAYAQFLSSDASLGSESQYVQGVNQTGCSQLQYSVLSDKKQEILILAANGRQVAGINRNIMADIIPQSDNFFDFYDPVIFTNPTKYYINNTFMTNLTDGVFRLAGYVQKPLQDTPVYVSVQLLDCPPGFTLTSQQRCDCDDRFLANLLSCNITDQTVSRYGNIWVNASFNGNTSNGVIIHKHCPFEYCKPEQLDVNLTLPETQCAFDRYGTLCGACKPNFSLVLGGSQCIPNCSSDCLLLLIPFALAGIALVFFIKLLNFTVSQGTINGVIFYANIVAANRSIFLPAQYNKMLSFLSVFISWLNLDLGIETCFIKGLDGYWKTWLQFVFPFYVWLIAAAIILASHYSTRATKIFGDKSASVLATLLLLSYAKLLRSIITIFSFTTLEYPDNSKVKVWSFDGNLQYFSAEHAPLFLFALSLFLILWLPYTAVLLSAQWLRTQTHRKGLRWLKPFLDAYYGPFKDRHHYWVGVLLVVRGVLFVFFASFFAIENNVNLLLIAITSVSIPIYTSITGRLYKKMYLTILENLTFLNLGVLGIGTLYIRLVGGNQEALVTTSVGITFLEFCGIAIFHSYRFVIVPIRKWYVKKRVNDQITIDSYVQLQSLLSSDSSDDDTVEYIPRKAVTHSEVCLSQLREEAQDPLNPTTCAEHQLPPASTKYNEQIMMPLNHEITRPNTRHSKSLYGANCLDFNEKVQQILNHDTPRPNMYPTMMTDAADNDKAGANRKSEAAAMPLDKPPPPPPQESNEPRYFAAEREERFIDFNAPRETLLEYTQYRLPQERNEPTRDSTAERELLSAPHEHHQERREPQYVASQRESHGVDFSALRESLLDYTQ